MARWITINWTGKFRFRGNAYYRNFKANAENEHKAKEQIVDYILAMSETGFVLEDQEAKVTPYGDRND